ncbi:hypothetical protein L202_08455 [Cryptococcus amylolentus CBS 6039]|uniref:NmrA-like domain-containing protein n=1 Tax=Cryptococcus amylolentus CBS 6039 TaxID=1295533 RepID=A0A1E3H9R5_9TREE|nr:hypothetical protein L202_08455 [Cryptococcus amylolentus CBS 6039]ODN73060.1 hypothetical protein L202_08455 [Cryptococcus amylolentus CBS 6039]
MSSNNILIVGATGKQGGATVQALLSQIASLSPSLTSPTIRFTTRSPSSPSARALASSGASSIRADLSSIDDLHSALQGIDVAFLVTDKDAGEEKEVEMGIRFVEAAKEVGVKHVVFASVADADVASTVPHFRTKYKIEQALIESGLSHTILRPVVFMENFPQITSASQTINVSAFFSTFAPKPLALISTTDIGHFAALALLNPTSPTFKNQIIPLFSGVYSVKNWEKATDKAGRKGWFWMQGAEGKVVWLTLSVTYRRMTEFFKDRGFTQIDVAALKKIHPGSLSLEDWVQQGVEGKAK